ncbi:ENTH-domain-containing protein [Halteromyces radiatus]|uniref:ENTH-domain-containing protein n=1 Tax=Halteromyces radiatus TaxID=101107 RepID=UPI0022203CB4|nr:ENTH-domain-containing protein [Halteromyces radiatus]KAI8098981.1 ENTH-domain-containing protein [Halteromyces radiatus]
MTTNNNKDYQVKGVFNKMKQAVHYYNEMESKVLQATNMDAWGAPSSLMRSLAQGTMESEKLNIIMPALYRRLTVKESKQWLQVYKGLVLLEYLLKYGDDQVLSYAQSHQDVLNSLKTFEYIDEKGQDKGVNGMFHPKEKKNKWLG